jgi:hypothetical protein
MFSKDSKYFSCVVQTLEMGKHLTYTIVSSKINSDIYGPYPAIDAVGFSDDSLMYVFKHSDSKDEWIEETIKLK